MAVLNFCRNSFEVDNHGWWGLELIQHWLTVHKEFKYCIYPCVVQEKTIACNFQPADIRIYVIRHIINNNFSIYYATPIRTSSRISTTKSLKSFTSSPVIATLYQLSNFIFNWRIHMAFPQYLETKIKQTCIPATHQSTTK